MGKEKDGGYVLPGEGIICSLDEFGNMQERRYTTRGMSLRQWYAGMALQGLLATGDFHTDQLAANVSEEAFHIADAMIAYEAKEKGE